MAVPTSKTELLAAVTTTFNRLVDDLAEVPPDRARETTMNGHVAGTTMSPADLVAYLIGWNELVLKWLNRDDRNESVDYPEVGFKWNQLGLLAQKFYADHSALGWHELLTRLTEAKARLTATITARSEEELYAATWYGKWTKGRMIQFNTSSPYANARTRLRAWLKAQAGLPTIRCHLPDTKKPRQMPRLMMKRSALKNEEPCNDSIQDSNNRFTEIAWRLPHQRSTKSDQSNTRSHPNSI